MQNYWVAKAYYGNYCYKEEEFSRYVSYMHTTNKDYHCVLKLT